MSESVAAQPRFLVTGATGFIGRRLVRRLLADFGPESVMCFTRAATASIEAQALEGYRSMGLRLIRGDLVNDPITSERPPAVQVVFHLAANIDTEATEAQASVNDVGTRRFLDWLRPMARGARIVYTSSVAVHDRDRLPTTAISEDSPLVPRTAYGVTKLRGEMILRERADQDGYSWTILRLPTVYGPGQKTEGLFDQMVRMARNGSLVGRIDWPGRTSVIYVDDVADVMIEFGLRAEAAGQIYCLASDESSLTVGELAREVGRAVGRPISPIAIPSPLMKVMRLLAWNRALQAAMPKFARLTFWRLSLIVSDGFWFDTAKFRRAYRKPLKNTQEGLATLLRESGT